MTRKTTAPAHNAPMRHFEFVGDKSSKFWEIRVSGDSVDVRYGKIGTDGQTQNKVFADATAASKHADKLIAEKLGKKYQESTATTTSSGKILEKKAANRPKASPAAKSTPVPRPTDQVVKIARSKEVRIQIQEATALKAQIMQGIQKAFSKVLLKKNSDSYEKRFLQQIALSAESFDLTFDAWSPEDVDRTSSMLSGPFFTSKKWPIPVADSEMLYPIVQLDLRSASSIIGEPLGDGLLQLWYDVNACEGMIRVIPRSAVKMQQATNFDFSPPDAFEGWPLSNNWGSDPCSDEVWTIAGFKSTGISSQGEYVDLYFEDISEEMPDNFPNLVESFKNLTMGGGYTPLYLFGTFYPIQYSAAEAGRKCLFGISDWGSAGNAQVFYEIGKDAKVSFFFWDSVR